MQPTCTDTEGEHKYSFKMVLQSFKYWSNKKEQLIKLKITLSPDLFVKFEVRVEIKDVLWREVVPCQNPNNWRPLQDKKKK